MKRAFLILVAVWMLALPSVGMAATLSGTVLEDKSGNPVHAGLLLWMENSSGGWDFVLPAETDETGRYVFTDLEAGTYYLECEAFADCNATANYCAEKYLPQIYNKVAAWDFEHKTEIVLETIDLKELEPILVKFRPFYFDTTPRVSFASTDGTVKITAKVINKTSAWVYMGFWGIVDFPGRTDHSSYYDLSAIRMFGQKPAMVIKPGANTVALTYKIPPRAPKGKYQYLIFGGSADGLSMLPEMDGAFYKGIPEDNVPNPLDSRRVSKTIPTKLSADGEVLERGPRPALRQYPGQPDAY